MIWDDTYEAVIGLEVHVQLRTRSKLFCGDSASYGGSSNTHVSPISLGHPGTLPRMNKKAIEHAIMLGLALNCEIVQQNYFTRKNYFYPDLPKGYQVTQYTTPICKNGYLTIDTATGEKKVTLNRIHIEEDAGKSLHSADELFSSIDFNRAGVPLLEIVTDPVLSSPEEAGMFITELRKIVRYLEVCDGNMEEGSMRCDANVSIRRKGDSQLGKKVEIKNLNSISNVKKAIQLEMNRMADMIRSGKEILPETRSYEDFSNTTFSLRTKEAADDYRYFPEPDLPPFQIADETITILRSKLPMLPAQVKKKYIEELLLSSYDADIICEERETSEYFQATISGCRNYKAVANWICGPVKSFLKENNGNIKDFPVSPEALCKLINLIDDGVISFSVAATRIFPIMIKEPKLDPIDIAIDLELIQQSNPDTLTFWIDEVLSNMHDKVLEYKRGKKGLMALFAGEVKKISKGQADMKQVIALLDKKLN